MRRVRFGATVDAVRGGADIEPDEKRVQIAYAQELSARDTARARVHPVHARFSVPGASQAAEDGELKKCP